MQPSKEWKQAARRRSFELEQSAWAAKVIQLKWRVQKTLERERCASVRADELRRSLEAMAATTVQCRARRGSARKVLFLAVRAATRAQTLARRRRAMLTVIEAKKQKKAARMLQATLRRHVAFKNFRSKRRGILRIQTQIRRDFVFRRYREKRRAVLRLRSLTRRRLARRFVLLKRRSTLLLQRFFRAILARALARRKRLEREEERHVAAMILTRFLRHRQKQQSAVLRIQRLAKRRSVTKIRRGAIVRIQSLLRRVLGGRRRQYLIAVRIIQNSLWRATAAKTLSTRRRFAARRLQASCRRRPAQSHYRITKAAAAFMNRVFRGRRGRRLSAFARRRFFSAVRDLQRGSRGLLGRRYARTLRRKRGAFLLTRVARGFLGRCRARYVLKVALMRFQCRNCGRVEPKGLYCKTCGYRRPPLIPGRRRSIIPGPLPPPRLSKGSSGSFSSSARTLRVANFFDVSADFPDDNNNSLVTDKRPEVENAVIASIDARIARGMKATGVPPRRASSPLDAARFRPLL